MLNGLWTRAWLMSVLIAAPSLAAAQDNPPEEAAPAEVAPAEAAPVDEPAAEEEEAAPEAQAEEPVAEEAPAEEAAAEEAVAPAEAAVEAPAAAAVEEAEAVEAEAPTADEPTAEAAAAEAAPDAAATTGAAQAGKPSKPKKGTALAALGTASPLPPETGRPWQVSATVETTLGTSVFVKDEVLSAAAFGYSFSAAGTYKIASLFEGRLDAIASIAFDQQVTATANDLGTGPRQFFFRDMRLGVLGRGLYTEKVTGIVVGAGSNINLPTSLRSQAEGRYFRWNLGGNLTKIFSQVGPGNLMLRVGTSFAKDFGRGYGVIDDTEVCNARATSLTSDGNCFAPISASNITLTHFGSATYIVGNLSFGLSLAMLQIFGHYYGDSEVGAGISEPGSSPHATSESTLSNLTWATISANYAFNETWSVSTGITTIQSPYINRSGNPRGVRFPFFDFENPSQNLSTFFLNASVAY